MHWNKYNNFVMKNEKKIANAKIQTSLEMRRISGHYFSNLTSILKEITIIERMCSPRTCLSLTAYIMDKIVLMLTDLLLSHSRIMGYLSSTYVVVEMNKELIDNPSWVKPGKSGLLLISEIQQNSDNSTRSLLAWHEPDGKDCVKWIHWLHLVLLLKQKNFPAVIMVPFTKCNVASPHHICSLTRNHLFFLILPPFWILVPLWKTLLIYMLIWLELWMF